MHDRSAGLGSSFAWNTYTRVAPSGHMSERARDPDLNSPTKMRVRILKCREIGETGVSDILDYNRATGRIELANASGDCPFSDSADEELAKVEL